MQRALFARLILQNADLILLDEPFNAVDYKTIQVLLNIIDSWKKENKTIISILHNYNQVFDHFDKTLIIAKEVVAFGKTSEVLTSENINKASDTELKAVGNMLILLKKHIGLTNRRYFEGFDNPSNIILKNLIFLKLVSVLPRMLPIVLLFNLLFLLLNVLVWFQMICNE